MQLPQLIEEMEDRNGYHEYLEFRKWSECNKKKMNKEGKRGLLMRGKENPIHEDENERIELHREGDTSVGF